MSTGGTASRSGIVFGLGAFGLWGLLPLYWALLDTTDTGEILAHRVVWSLPTALVLVALVRDWGWIRPLLRQPRRLALIAASAALITVNWYVFIWAVASDHVLEASLGYFINPLLTIALGVVLLRERLRRAQWAAVAVGGLAVVVMSVAYGQVPWISLTLSVSFGVYGLVKKTTGLDGLQGFTADSAFQFLPALVFVVVLGARGDGTFTTEGAGHTALLVGSGLATALPLIFFGAAAVRLPLSMIGMMQYIAPTAMFLLGLLAFDEEMPPERWIGFLLVWTALTILTWDALRTARANRRTVAVHTPATTTATAPAPVPAPDEGRAHPTGR
ncbi:EamA family transporter RarD [Streptomyces avicenniae]|uniref:EamA family transporter RarD n=1 Tax=Streptomyces avicenniae TaxID=500153 RepID=UPI000AD4EA37|nr:EamA family transporter RarD [Streptomyces avicenniae]